MRPKARANKASVTNTTDNKNAKLVGAIARHPLMAEVHPHCQLQILVRGGIPAQNLQAKLNISIVYADRMQPTVYNAVRTGCEHGFVMMSFLRP